MKFKIHDNSLKLSSLYLAVIMSISVFFSVILYQVSVDELNRSIKPQAGYIKQKYPFITPYDMERILEDREDRAKSAKLNVLNKLIIINLVILLGGGFLSYYLAARTLKPIEEAHEAQNRFTADASHELRTPITALITENEVTLMDPKLSLKDSKAQLESNVEELQKLSNLTDGLLRLSGLDNKELLKEEFDLVIAANNALARVETLAAEKKIDIKTNIPDELIMVGDIDGIQEVIFILLDNAVKYSPEESKVKLDISQDSAGINITVTDKGFGIKSTELPHIFDRFYQADSSRTKQTNNGHGLGLAIAKEIVEKHGGSITAESTINKGTKIKIQI